MYKNRMKLYTYVLFTISFILTIFFPKSIYGLIIFTSTQLLSIGILLIVSKIKQKPLSDILNHKVALYNYFIGVLGGIIFFLGVLTINHYINEFRWDKSLQNLPLMLFVLAETIVITTFINFLVKLIKKELIKSFIWKIILNSLILLGLIASVIIGPLIHSYHTDWIMNIHIVFSLCVVPPAIILLFVTYLIELFHKTDQISTHKNIQSFI